MNDKYIVYNRVEFERWLKVPHETPQEIEDAVVIRRQDIFAPPAFDAYANCIQAAIEVTGNGGDKLVVERLRQIADYFHQQAVLAWETVRRLPD